MDFLIENAMKEEVCKNCECLHKKWIEVGKQRDDKEKELVGLSRKYTRALHTIDILNKW